MDTSESVAYDLVPHRTDNGIVHFPLDLQNDRE